jgi:hypothetical protein
MTVAELIEYLKQWPADRRVVVAGYESGFCDVGQPAAIKLLIDANDPEDWFSGPHDDTEEDGEDAVLLDRAKRS